MSRTPHSSRFGQIVRSLRMDLVDLETNQPWTQKKLGEVSNLGRATIGKIERGDQAKLDGTILVPLGKALNLSTLMEREFNDAAVDREEWASRAHEEVAAEAFQQVWSMLEQSHQPAYITNATGDILAMNLPLMQFHNILSKHRNRKKRMIFDTNTIDEFFRQPALFHRGTEQRYDSIARSYIQQFLWTSLSVRHAEAFQSLLPALKRFPKFRFLYQTERETPSKAYNHVRELKYEHALHGDVHYSVLNTMTRTPFGYLTFSLLCPLSASTEATFHQLADAGVGAFQLGSWPKR